MSTRPEDPEHPDDAKPPSQSDSVAKPETPDEEEPAGVSPAWAGLLQQLQPAQQKHLKPPPQRSGPSQRARPAKPVQKNLPRTKAGPEPLRDADLEWFDIRRYDTARLMALSLADWEGLISSRLMYQTDMGLRVLSEAELKYLSDIKRPDQDKWLGHFLDYLKRDPLDPERSTNSSWHPKHKTDTASISTLLFTEAYGIGDSLQSHWPEATSEPYSFPNDRYEKRGGLDSLVVPVKVNFAVTKTKLVEDFEAWVENIQSLDKRLKAKLKNFPSLMHIWVTKSYLPYFDLNLYARAKNGTISQKQYVSLLNLDLNSESDYDTLLEAPRSSPNTFTPELISAIRAQLARNQLNGDGEMYAQAAVTKTSKAKNENGE
jgi:hypothetical protein